MTLYMEVTTDKYELPVAVADSVRELAELRGVNRCTIFKALWLVKNGGRIKSKYIKVEV